MRETIGRLKRAYALLELPATKLRETEETRYLAPEIRMARANIGYVLGQLLPREKQEEETCEKP